MNCEGCRIFDPQNQRSVKARMKKGWNPIVWNVYNGRSVSTGKGDHIQLSSYIIACKMHEDVLIAGGGWDGTGKRQNTEA